MNRYLTFITLFLIICFVSCVPRNEYGSIRANKIRFSNKKCVDENVFEKIDTSAVYLAELNAFDTGEPYINGFKFYGGHKVSFFVNLKLDQPNSLDPKKAKMGYYNTCSEPYTIQIAYHHVQSGIFISKKEFEIVNDTLIVKTLKSPQAFFRVTKYYKQQLPLNQLRFNPDW